MIVDHVERWLPSPLGDRPYCYLIVLTVGCVHDYAAYSGIIPDHDGGLCESFVVWVACHGDKISEQEARLHFPVLPEDAAYRG